MNKTYYLVRLETTGEFLSYKFQVEHAAIAESQRCGCSTSVIKITEMEIFTYKQP